MDDFVLGMFNNKSDRGGSLDSPIDEGMISFIDWQFKIQTDSNQCIYLRKKGELLKE